MCDPRDAFSKVSCIESNEFYSVADGVVEDSCSPELWSITSLLLTRRAGARGGEVVVVEIHQQQNLIGSTIPASLPPCPSPSISQ